MTNMCYQATARGQTPQPLIGLPPRGNNRRVSSSSVVPTQQRSVSRATTVNEELPLRPSTSAGPVSGRPISIAGNQARGSGPTGRITVARSRPTTAHGEPALRSPMREAGKESPAETTTAPAVARLDATIDDMDKITKGIKKIKINLITQSQKEAREKARLEAEQAAAAAAAAVAKSELRTSSASTNRSVESSGLKTPNSATGRRPTINAASPDGTMPALSTASESSLSTPNLEHFTPRTVSPESRQAVPNVSSPRSTKALDETTDFYQYQPEGPPPVSIAPQEPLKWMPPTLPAGNPMVMPGLLKKKSSALFQYGSSGTIPFAPKQSVNRSPSPDKAQRKPSGTIRGTARSPPRK